MKIEKKHIIAGTIGLVTITGAIAYLQYKRLMNYTLKLGSIQVKKVTAKLISFDLFLNFKNNSDIKISISKKIANIYLNDKFVTKIESFEPMTIAPMGVSTITTNVEFNPSDVLKLLKKNYADIILNPQSINIKIDVKLKAKLWFFNVNISEVYNVTLKDLLTKKETE
jgi:LEA14-like dessication related protein